jgi:hypothetical protein
MQSYLLKRGLPWVEVALLAAWVVWCPLLIWLACFRLQWYVRHRTPLVCTLRVCRMLSGEPCSVVGGTCTGELICTANQLPPVLHGACDAAAAPTLPLRPLPTAAIPAIHACLLARPSHTRLQS